MYFTCGMVHFLKIKTNFKKSTKTILWLLITLWMLNLKKKKLNFDIDLFCTMKFRWIDKQPGGFEIYAVTIRISMTEYHHGKPLNFYVLFILTLVYGRKLVW